MNPNDNSNTIGMPSDPIRWPAAPSVLTQLQQVKAAGISPKPNVATPNSPANVTPTTQGLPQNLSNVRVRKTSLNSTQFQLTISFDHNPGDPYYKETNILMRQGSGSPVTIGTGAVSPITVTVNKSTLPTTIFAQASGNWGSVAVGNAPTQTISLADTSKQ